MNRDLRNQGLLNNTITNSGATYSSDGKLGGCYVFDGVNDSLTVGNLSTMVDTDFSFACWFYKDEWGTKGYETIFGGSSGFELESKVSSTNSPVLKLYNWGGGSCTYELSKWNHIVFTRNATETKLYLNGELKAIGTAGTIPNHDYFVGSWNSTTQQNFKGKMCDVRIYDHCLSEMEVKELSKGLVLHYPLNRQGWGQENLLSRYVVPGQAAPTSTAAGGRTTWLGDYKITIPATENADTYFRLFTTKKLTTNATYTISCNVEGLLSGSYYRFPLYAQGNTAMGVLNLDHNGLCSLTFTMTYGTQTAATGANGETVYICFMDDSSRAITSGQGAITISNFKLEEGSIATPWCPNSSDILATTMGLNGTTEYDCSGFCNNGTRTGTFTWTSDTPKYSVSTYMPKAALITHPRPVFGGTDQEWTCAMWVKLDTVNQSGIAMNNFNVGNNIVHSANGMPLLYANSGSNDYYNYGNKAVTAGVWTHVAFVFRNSDVTKLIYINGVEQTNKNGPNKTSTPSGIQDVVTVGYNLAGYISDYRVYATALSADDVKSLYQNCATIDPDGTIRGQIRS